MKMLLRAVAAVPIMILALVAALVYVVALAAESRQSPLSDVDDSAPASQEIGPSPLLTARLQPGDEVQLIGRPGRDEV